MPQSPLWTPSTEQVDAARMSEFARFVESRTGQKFPDYEALHAWSISPDGAFWDAVWDFAELEGEKGARIVADGDKMPAAAYYPDGHINFAANLLKFDGDGDAIVFKCEDKLERRISRDELRAEASRYQKAFLALGLKKGDRIAAMLPNMPETIIAMIAATALGAIWSSCSPDFGPKGVIDRFGQTSPKIFLTCDGYWYNGKRQEVAGKLSEIVPVLEAEKTIIFPLLGEDKLVADGLPNTIAASEFLDGHHAGEMVFEQLPFDHPLFIMFSSGTTGVPKCIVHSHGGTLLKLVSEHQLQVGMKPGDRIFYFTTCGWMMWNWLAGALASGVTLLLFDGSPFAPDHTVLFDYADREGATLFGTSAKFIDAVRNTGFKPIDHYELAKVRLISSTGSPLAPENFDFVYSGIKSDVHLASMSGGTDIMGCFVAGIPWRPVYKGEIQGKSLGMAVEVWDDDGNPMTEGKGELMCVRPFPSMPVKFWNDEGGSKYHDAYFDRFDNVWCHGDFAEWTETGGMVIHGRSDATLNPSGVRIGTAEIYNPVEQMPAIEEALCIGQQWQDDTRVVLFVRTAEGVTLDDALQAEIRKRIRELASPRHVPAKIIAVADIPRTKSGKITELAVRDVVHGREVKNREALANPEALDLFVDLEELST